MDDEDMPFPRGNVVEVAGEGTDPPHEALPPAVASSPPDSTGVEDVGVAALRIDDDVEPTEDVDLHASSAHGIRDRHRAIESVKNAASGVYEATKRGAASAWAGTKSIANTAGHSIYNIGHKAFKKIGAWTSNQLERSVKHQPDLNRWRGEVGQHAPVIQQHTTSRTTKTPTAPTTSAVYTRVG